MSGQTFNFITDVDFNQFQALALRLANLAEDPISGLPGQVYFNTTTKCLRVNTDSGWTELKMLQPAVTYTHQQDVANDIWIINHTLLGRHPAVTVVDSAGTTVIGDISYPSDNQVVVSFQYPFSGKAYLN